MRRDRLYDSVGCWTLTWLSMLGAFLLFAAPPLFELLARLDNGSNP